MGTLAGMIHLHHSGFTWRNAVNVAAQRRGGVCGLTQSPAAAVELSCAGTATPSASTTVTALVLASPGGSTRDTASVRFHARGLTTASASLPLSARVCCAAVRLHTATPDSMHAGCPPLWDSGLHVVRSTHSVSADNNEAVTLPASAMP